MKEILKQTQQLSNKKHEIRAQNDSPRSKHSELAYSISTVTNIINIWLNKNDRNNF